MISMRIMRIGIVVLSIFILIGILLMLLLPSAEENTNVIKVKLDSENSELIEFENLNLLPAQQTEYTVVLKKITDSKYDLRIEFCEIEDKNLKNFAYVKIESDGNIIYNELLKDAFESEGIMVPVNFKEKTNTEFNVVYYMPEEVGNEAQNAAARFELKLTASNE